MNLNQINELKRSLKDIYFAEQLALQTSQERWRDEIDMAEKLVEKSGKLLNLCPLLCLEYARILIVKKEYPKAEKYLEKAQIENLINWEHRKFNVLRSIVQEKTKDKEPKIEDYAGLISALSSHLKNYPCDLKAFSNLVNIYKVCGKIPIDVDLSIEDKCNFDTQYELYQIYMKNGMTDEAIELLEFIASSEAGQIAYFHSEKTQGSSILIEIADLLKNRADEIYHFEDMEKRDILPNRNKAIEDYLKAVIYYKKAIKKSQDKDKAINMIREIYTNLKYPSKLIKEVG